LKIIAHRGFSKSYPENTIISFEKAIEAGVDMIETDIRLSADNIPIVFHDKTLLRVSKIDQKPENKKLEELKKLDAGSWFHEDFSGLGILTLDELIEKVHGRTSLILEMKFYVHTYKRACIEIESRIRDKVDWVEISSFSDLILHTIFALNPRIALHKLIHEKKTLEMDNFDEIYAFVQYFDIEVSLKDHPKVSELIKTHKVIFWTVDDEPIQEQIDSGLYGAMSNDPVSLKHKYEKTSQRS